jgi:hypothetical protein
MAEFILSIPDGDRVVYVQTQGEAVIVNASHHDMSVSIRLPVGVACSVLDGLMNAIAHLAFDDLPT